MDWLTLTVEIIGGVMVCVWAVLPAREFVGIYRTLKGKGHGANEQKSAGGGQ